MAGVTLASPDATRAAGRRLGRALQAGDLLILTGPLGAGKTTFTQGLGEGLGVRGPVTSPTFVIARVHPSLVDGPELLHVDAYRLETASQMWDLDLDTDYAVTVVEWGRGKAEELTSDWLELTIERPQGQAADLPQQRVVTTSDSDPSDAPGNGDESRLITWESRGNRWADVDIASLLTEEHR